MRSSAIKLLTLTATFIIALQGAAADISHALQSDIDKYNALYDSADVAYTNAEYAKARQIVDDAMPLARKLGGESMIDMLYLASIVCSRQGDISMALQYCAECVDFDRASGNKENLSSSLNSLAGIYLMAGMPDEAIEHIDEAIAIERILDRPESLCVRLGMASEVMMKLNKPAEALAFAAEAYQVEQALGNQNKIPVRKSQLAAVLVALNRVGEARDMLIEAAQELRALNNRQSLAITLNVLGDVEIRTGHLSSAEAYLRESIDLTRSMGNRLLEYKASKMLGEILSEVNPAEAIPFMKRCSVLSDSLYTENLASELQTLNVKYEMADKQKALELQARKLKISQCFHFILGVIVVLLLALVVICWRMIKEREKRNRLLVAANKTKENLLELAQKETDELRKHQLGEVASRIKFDIEDIELTKRERQIIVMFAQGMLAKEVAEQLGISQRTVETHKQHIYKKLNINNTVELLSFAKQMGLLD